MKALLQTDSGGRVYRIEPNSRQIEALRRHSDELAAELIRIYRLPPGAASQLEALAERRDRS